MRRITLAILSTISALMLLFSYHTSTDSQSGAGAAPTPAGAGLKGSLAVPTPSSTSSSPTRSATSRSSSSGAAPGASPSPATSSATAQTYTGDAVQTQWGIVQVEITVANGKITKAEAIQYPQGNPRDDQINQYAVPTLDQEVLAAQSANIDAVSGATVTSGGYLQSLQAAVDQAHL